MQIRASGRSQTQYQGIFAGGLSSISGYKPMHAVDSVVKFCQITVKLRIPGLSAAIPPDDAEMDIPVAGVAESEF